MDLHTRIVGEMHRVVPNSCYDYRADALPSVIKRGRSIFMAFSGLAISIGAFLIRTGKALQQAARPEPLTPKSSDYLLSHQ